MNPQSNIDPSKVAIISTVINFTLYDKTSKFYPDYRRFVIDGRDKMYAMNSIRYMMRKLRNEKIDWLIMADEDVVFTDPDKIHGLIEHMAQNDYMFCGVRDGGMVRHRTFSPYAINTFFSILNFAKLKQIWNEQECLSQQFTVEGEFDDDLSQLRYPYDTNVLYEPYYCFYFWMRRQGLKALYLDSRDVKDDPVANIVSDHEGNEIVCHTWYSRAYEKDAAQTARINGLIESFNLSRANTRNHVIFKDGFFKWRKKIKLFIKHRILGQHS